MVQVLLRKPANFLALPKRSSLNNNNSGGQNRKYKPKFYILGHSQTGTNASGRIKGSSDFSKLTELGKSQAKALGKEAPFNSLTIGMIITEKLKPKMKLKATEGRYFIAVLLYMLEHFFPRSSPHEHARYKCVWHLVQCYKEMDSWIPEESPHRLATHGRRCCLL